MNDREIAQKIVNGTFKGDIELTCYKTCFTLIKSYVHAWIKVKRVNNVYYLRFEAAGDTSIWKEIPEYLFYAIVKYQSEI